MTLSGALISDEDEASLDPVSEFTEWDSHSENTGWHQ